MEQGRLARFSGGDFDTAVDSLNKDRELSIDLAFGTGHGGVDETHVLATGGNLGPLEEEGQIGRVAAVDRVFVPVVRARECKLELNGRFARASKVREFEVAAFDLVNWDFGELEANQGTMGAPEPGVGVRVAADIQDFIIAVVASGAFASRTGFTGLEDRVHNGRVFCCFCDEEPSVGNVDEGQDGQSRDNRGAEQHLFFIVR